jgi:hypothetical protein
MTKPANDNRFLAIDVADLEAAFADMLAAFPELQDDAELRADTIETNAYEILARLIDKEREADSMASATAGRISALQARKQRHEKTKDAMRSLMFRIMKAGGLQKVPLAEATVSIGKKAAAVEITDEALLPASLVKVTLSPDKAAIKAALAAGPVPGARMGEAGETLTVRAA